MGTVKERLKKAGKTQVWLLKELRQWNIRTSPSELSMVLNGVVDYQKASYILKTSEDILDCYGY